MRHPLDLCRQLIVLTAATMAASMVAGPAQGQSTDAEFDALRRAGKAAELESLAREKLAKNARDDVALWHLSGAVVNDPKKRDELIALTERCIADTPRSARCHNALGNLYGNVASTSGMAAGLKYAGKVKEHYVTAAEIDPKQFEFRRDLNQFYLFAPRLMGGGAGKALRGAEDFEKIDRQRGQVLRAQVQTHEEEFDDAEALLGAIKPGTDVALAEAVQDATSALGIALIDDEQAARARKVFERQIAADPRYAFAHFGLGRALLELKELDGAIAALELALQLDPKSRAHYRLGIAYQGKGDSARALAMFRQFLTYQSQGRAADDARKRIGLLTQA